MHHFICLLNMEHFKSLWCTGPSLQSPLFHLFRPADPWNAYMHIHGNRSCKEENNLVYDYLELRTALWSCYSHYVLLQKNPQTSSNSLPTQPHHLVYNNYQSAGVQAEHLGTVTYYHISWLTVEFLKSSHFFEWILLLTGNWECSCNNQNFCTNSQTSIYSFSSFMKPINTVCRNPSAGLNMKFHFLQWLNVHLQFEHWRARWTCRTLPAMTRCLQYRTHFNMKIQIECSFSTKSPQASLQSLFLKVR